MADYSLPRIKENELPEATSIDKVRVLDDAGKSVWVEKEDLPITEEQVTGLTDALALKADANIQIAAGAGLTGGGDLSENRTINVASADDGITVNADNIKLNIVNDLVTTSATRPLSAKQGKKLQDEITQLAGEVSLFKEESNLKDAIQDSKIKDIESIISTMNPNQSAQLSVSGVSPLSLPKNAANGGMEVKLEGLTAENLVVNGDFRDGTTGWINGANAVNIRIDGGMIAYDSTGGWNGIMTPINIQTTSGDKCYIKTSVIVDQDTSDIYSKIGFYKPNIVNYDYGELVANRMKSISAIITSSFTGLSSIRLVTGAASGAVVKWGKTSLINLTQIFGAGNEPDLETCDAMFSDYFEGVKSFVPTGRVRSVGKNLFDGIWEKGSIGGTGQNVSGQEGTAIRIPLPIKVEPSTTYILINSASADQRIFYYDNNGDFIYYVSTVVNTFTTPSNCRFVRFRLLTTDQSVNTMLAKSNAVIPYELYKETNLYLTAPELRSNGAVKDEIRKGSNGYELVKRISDVDGSVLATPEIIPISYGGVLNSAENGTVYHEPIIADAGVYGTDIPIFNTDYPIASIEEIIKHEGGVDTYLDVSTAVIAGDKLSFTHPSLQSGDLVLFTYAFNKESTNGNITATFYDSNVVKIDTVTGTAYRINEVVTNGELIRTLTEV